MVVAEVFLVVKPAIAPIHTILKLVRTVVVLGCRRRGAATVPVGLALLVARAEII